MAAKPLKKSAAAQKTVAAGSLLNMAKPGDRQGVALDALAADLMPRSFEFAVTVHLAQARELCVRSESLPSTRPIG